MLHAPDIIPDHPVARRRAEAVSRVVAMGFTETDLARIDHAIARLVATWWGCLAPDAVSAFTQQGFDADDTVREASLYDGRTPGPHLLAGLRAFPHLVPHQGPEGLLSLSRLLGVYAGWTILAPVELGHTAWVDRLESISRSTLLAAHGLAYDPDFDAEAAEDGLSFIARTWDWLGA